MKMKLLLFIILLIQLKIYAQFGNSQFISSVGGAEIYTFDFDGDGDLDILKAESNITAWHENTDGNGNFGSQQIISSESGWAATFASDLDGDGDIDVLTILEDWASGVDYFKIVWFENTDGLGNFGPEQIVADSIYLISRSVFSEDFDGDGDMDILSGSHGDVFWFENIDGLGDFGSKKNITSNVEIVREVFSSDLDNDGDMDVLVSSIQDDKITWYENIDGLGNFGSQQIIASNIGEVWSIFTSDLNSDGDMDVLIASWLGGEICWFENLDGLGNFSTKQIITTNANGASKVYASDLDGDGDIDVLSASLDPPISKISWYRNTNGLGDFGPQLIINQEGFLGSALFAGDLDNDNDIDVIGASPSEGVVWFENLQTLSIYENKLDSFIIYPNPVQQTVTINYPSNFIVETIELFDSMGRLVLQNKGKDYINVSNLDSGLFVIKIKTNEGVFINKIIKN